MNRREFVLSGAAAAAAMGVVRAAQRDAVQQVSSQSHRVVFDSRFVESRAFATALPPRFLPPRPTNLRIMPPVGPSTTNGVRPAMHRACCTRARTH